jgi:hypothetical protein
MKTVKVRIAVAVDSDGDWNAFGRSGVSDLHLVGVVKSSVASVTEAHYFVEAELAIPDVHLLPTVAGTAEVAQ